jgi:hypothetical protein
VFGIKPKTAAVPSGQRGSFSFQNDNDFNRATAGPKAGMRGGAGENIRNPRSEYNANRQIAGNPAETAERAEILRRLSGQRGSVQVMNPKPQDLPLEIKPQPKTPVWTGQQPEPPEPEGAWYQDATSKQKAALSKLPPTAVESRKLSLAPFSDDSNEVAQASYTDHELVPGVRDIPLKDLGIATKAGKSTDRLYSAGTEHSRIADLAKKIRTSGTISPLHVGVGSDGKFELLEGQHRARALSILGHSSVPARVIVDMSEEKR